MSREGKERMAIAVDALIRGGLTRDELGKLVGIAPESANHLVRRLREEGYPVEVIDKVHMHKEQRGLMQAVYRIVYPPGRRCAEEGCGTLLRRTNPSDRCELHGGGYIPWPDDPPDLPPIVCSQCGEETSDYLEHTGNWRICRPCYREWRKRWSKKRRSEKEVAR